MTMPSTDTAFPKFPTQFNEEDVKRLGELEEQRRAMEEAYKVKFSRQAWAGVSPLEKAVRRGLPPQLAPVTGILPGVAETLEWGFTPEQFQESLREFNKEYKELSRKQKVTELLPNIKSDLVLAALMGEPIDEGELLSAFPELQTDFNEAEISYLARLAQKLVRATPEEILSGDLFTDLPLSYEDYEAFLRKKGQRGEDLRFIEASIAFGRDEEQLAEALKQAYPSDTSDEEAAKALKAKFKQRVKELGVPEGETLTKEAIRKFHEKAAKEAGEVLILTNDEGDIFSARKQDDGSVWIGRDLKGYWDEDTQRVVPIDFFTGQPLKTEEEQESALKDLWDSFYLGLIESSWQFGQAIKRTIPSAILSLYQRAVPYTAIGGEKYKEARVQEIQKWRDSLQVRAEERDIAHQLWLEKNPELVPRPGYNQNPFEHTELLKDPYYYAYTMLSNAPLMLTALGVGLITTAATGNPLAGAVAGAATMTPVEINSVYEDLVANGADPFNATELATLTGTAIGAIEIFPGMIALRAISPVFMRAFRKNIQRELTRQVVQELSARGILATATKIEVAEVLEEVIQQAMQNAAVKTVNENRSIVENLDQVAIETAIAVLPLAGFGGGAQYLNMKANLPPSVQQEIGGVSKTMQEAGLSEEHAEAVAVTQVMETETGQAQVEEALGKAEKAPITSEEITRLESKITSYTEEIAVTMTSLEAQRDRLEKMRIAKELPSDRLAQTGLIQTLEIRLKDLELNKKLLIKERNKAVKAAAPLEKSFSEMTEDEQGRVIAARAVYQAGKEIPHEVPTFPDIAPESVLTDELTGRFWDMFSKEEKLGLAEQFGIAKTAANKSWSELTGVQRERLRGIQQVPPIQAEPITSGQRLTPFVAEWMEDPLLPTRRPRAIDWEIELALIEESYKDPNMSKHLKLPDGITAIRTNAELALNRRQDEYQEAKKAKDRESISDIETRLKDMARQAGLRSKALLGKRWDDLPPDDQKQLALSLLPDGSLEFKARKEFLDMEYFMEFLEELTGVPFYPLLRRTEAANAAAETAKERIMKRITADPTFKPLLSDEEALGRIALAAAIREGTLSVEQMPELSEAEMFLLDATQAIYNSYQPHVRYIRVMRTMSTIEDFRKEFPDAVEGGKEFELELAIKLKEEGNLDDLWAFLFNKTWGVYEHGFDPRFIADPTLKVRRGGGTLEVTRGEGRLLRRESIEYPAGKFAKNYIARLVSYVEQMELQWRIEPELDVFNDYWNMVGKKFLDWGELKRGLETWVARLQNIGLGYNWADRQIRRLWRQSMAAVFLEPYMSFRNSFQALMFHPDRTELFRLIGEPLPTDLKEKGKLYYDTFVEQLGGLRKDWLHVGEKGFLIPDAVNRLADNLTLYGYSDYFPRLWSFNASLGKANRAMEKYLQDGNVTKWLKDSGAMHLRVTERNHVLSLYLNHAGKTFDSGITGLREISGADMASFYVSHRIADITHFKYRRSTRGLLEMGVTGSTLWNLIVFPRGYSQRLYFQAEKIKRVFAGEATWAEAGSGFNDIMKLTVTSILFGQIFFLLTGRKRNPWNPLNILLGWQFGGLFVGIAQDVSKFFINVGALINPFSDDDSKDRAWGEIPMALERIPETLVPFFRRATDIGEIIITEVTDKDVKLRHMVRLMRGWLDENYTPAELDELDMSLWEKVRKAILGGQPADLTTLEQTMKDIDEAEGKIGSMSPTGKFYTVGDYGRQLSSLIKDTPNALINEQEGFSPLALFYVDSEAQWAELYTLPSDERDDWRKTHLEEEAMLLFWEKYSRSVFFSGTPEGERLKSLLQMWFDQYGIDRAMHKEWSSWQLPVEIPAPEE